MALSLSKRLPIYSFTLLFATALSFPSLANENDKPNSVWDVIEAFKHSIQEKDEALFISLFLTQNVSWVGVISDKTLSDLEKKDKKFAEQPKVMNSSPQEFIKDIVNSNQENKETFKNVKITSDKEVASVSFNYDFFKDGKLTNHGQEHWQLVNTRSGWKINAVNFSFTLVL